MHNQEAVKIAEKVAWSYIGKFYKWGGDDPSGFDCSGYAIEILKSVGKLLRKGDWTAEGLYKIFEQKATDKPYSGCLVFWGYCVSNMDPGILVNNQKYHITHVEFCISDTLSIGASGGGSRTLTESDAIRDNAYIKVRPIVRDGLVVFYVDPFLSD